MNREAAGSNPIHGKYVRQCVQVMDQIQGVNGQKMAWEGSKLTSKKRNALGVFRNSLLKLLNREPALRPSMAEFCDTCNRVLTGGTTVEVEGKSY